MASAYTKIVQVGLLVALFAASQTFVPSNAALAQTGRPAIMVVRIDTQDAPVIDGDLSEAVWARAMAVDDFKQKRPNPGAPPSERTVLRILYDENNLYFSVYAYDSMPDQIAVRAMARDGAITTGDKFSLYLDPGATRRDAYFFQIGASGGRADSLILNNTEELENWDPIWSADARLVEDGWTAEVAIPFQSISYDEDGGLWGFEFTRNIRRSNEQIQWAVQNPALNFLDISQAGDLTGITDVTQGLGLDVQVYGVAKTKRDWHVPGDETSLSFTAGGNAFYRITPALTGTLTFNPDFSDAPLDARQVNTTRFSLFTPETRDFFLQDAAAFQFGGYGFTRDRDANNGRPFFSRNVGLVDGQQVGIIGGGKLSGRVEGLGVGVLSVLTAENELASKQLLSVARVTHTLFDNSRIGFIATNGDPAGESENTVIGADYGFRSSNFLGGGTFQGDFYFQRSFSSVSGDDNAFGVVLTSPNEPWGWDTSFKQIGTNFDPALGFVNRSGVRLYGASAQHMTRFTDHFLRELRFRAVTSIATSLRNKLESRTSQFGMRTVTSSDDTIEVLVEENFENVANAFDVAGTIVPAGRYSWTNVFASLRTTQGRPIGGALQVTCCRFFGGDAIAGTLSVELRPNQYFDFAASWEANFIKLPTGSVDIHILTATGAINFTPNMGLLLQAQYDNVSDAFGFLSRFRWEYSPGNELFVALGQSADWTSRFRAERTLLSVRLGQTFRF